MAGLGGTIAFGPYTMTYDGNDVGLSEGPKRLTIASKAKLIYADRYGDTAIDGIYTGGDWFLTVIFKEWTANIRAAIWPFGTFGEIGVPGKKLTDLAKVFVLTAVAGTPAATAGPATLTCHLAVPSEGNSSEILLGNDQRNVPVQFRLYPNASGVCFAMT